MCNIIKMPLFFFSFTIMIHVFYLELNVIWCQDKQLQEFYSQGLDTFSSVRRLASPFCFSFKHTPVIQQHFLLKNFSARLVKYLLEEMFSSLRVIENFKAWVFGYWRSQLLRLQQAKIVIHYTGVFAGWFSTADLFEFLTFHWGISDI